MKPILKIVAVASGGLSLFRLGSLLFEQNLAGVIRGILDAYHALLTPITAVLGPLFAWMAGWVNLTLPEWWPHAFVIWVVVGGVSGRAWASEEGVGDPDFAESTLGSVIGCLLGPFGFLWAAGQSALSAFDGDSDFLVYLSRETGLVLLSACAFFATNSFA